MNIELKVEDKLNSENVSKITESGKEITDKAIEKSLNYDALSDSEKKAVDEFITKIDVMNQNLVLQLSFQIKSAPHYRLHQPVFSANSYLRHNEIQQIFRQVFFLHFLLPI